MPKQPAIPGLRDALKKKVTRREQFLAEMDAVVPWTRLLALIAPHYPKTGPKGGRPPMPLETMLRVYFLQQWYALSDPMAEEMLYDSDAMRHFAGIELGDDRIPDETTIFNFRHLREKHQLTEQLFVEVKKRRGVIELKRATRHNPKDLSPTPLSSHSRADSLAVAKWGAQAVFADSSDLVML